MVSEEWPEAFNKMDLSTVGVKFVLVVKNSKIEWLDPLKNALDGMLYCVSKTWALPPLYLVVLNEAGAQKIGLIKNE